jgi:tripartite-type tricarboxylate transporter receptor subunit TctC
MATNGEIAIIPAISTKLRYDPRSDLIPIAMVTNTPFVWSANLSSQINTLPELVAAAKAKPNQIAYSSAGIGSSAHMATEQFAAATHIKLLHVPYRGGAPAAAAIVSGDVSVAALALSSVLPLIDSGKIKLLAVTSRKRTGLVPDVPTVIETGVLTDFQSSIWTGLFAPKGTPEPILAKIEADVVEVLNDPAVMSRLEQVGAEAVGMPGAPLKVHIDREIDELTKLATQAGIRLE